MGTYFVPGAVPGAGHRLCCQGPCCQPPGADACFADPTSICKHTCTPKTTRASADLSRAPLCLGAGRCWLLGRGKQGSLTWWECRVSGGLARLMQVHPRLLQEEPRGGQAPSCRTLTPCSLANRPHHLSNMRGVMLTGFNLRDGISALQAEPSRTY